MRKYVILCNAEKKTVALHETDNRSIKEYKRLGFEIIGRVKIDSGFNVTDVKLR